MTTTLNALYLKTRDQLRKGGVESPDLAARLLVRAVLDVSDIDLIASPGMEVSREQEERAGDYTKRRLAGEPVSRIFGEREFRSLPFTVTPAVLDPRADTETLVEAALNRFARRAPAAILDLGTGSGCIAISLLKEWPAAKGTGVDISPDALAVAAGNARRHGVLERLTLLEGDWFAPVQGVFDLIVANPPYISSGEIESLAPEVKNHDPILALDGGNDGVRAYKKILENVKNHLDPQGRCFFEIGAGQADDVARLAEDAGLVVKESYKDLAGIVRVLEIASGEN